MGTYLQTHQAVWAFRMCIITQSVVFFFKEKKREKRREKRMEGRVEEKRRWEGRKKGKKKGKK